ncbi:MAG: glucose-1-phosphate adenylyltransferase [Candidatus Latescibacteria bacterium]|nr:glucose-1-phosphate adenylyltransferase [Candidatus Latescibacterota bacterium]
MKDVLGIILGGGQGKRLFPLTLYRSKPAVPIGGKYRLIDIPISNCLHAGIDKVFVLTQFNSTSLHRHISNSYRFDNFSDGFVEILAAMQTQDTTNWYQGTADAVRQQLRHIMSRRADQCLILSGDHLYRMDYRAFVEEHRRRGAEVSIAVKPVGRDQAPGLGILKMDPDGRIVDFREKPQPGPQLEEMRLPGGGEERYLASMGIYLFEPQVLTSLLMATKKEDFGKHIIPEAIQKVGVYAHQFDGYWEDIGTISSFFDANLALTSLDPHFEFYQHKAPIYTRPRFLPGARIEGCQINRSIISEGSHIQAQSIDRSVIGVRSVIGPGAQVVETVMMGADFYDTPADLERFRSTNTPAIGIGAGAVVRRAIIDKNARIGAGVRILNEAGIEEADGQGYFIRDGIVVVAKNGVIPAGTLI